MDLINYALSKKIANLTGASDEQVQNAVNNYMEAHPFIIDVRKAHSFRCGMDGTKYKIMCI